MFLIKAGRTINYNNTPEQKKSELKTKSRISGCLILKTTESHHGSWQSLREEQTDPLTWWHGDSQRSVFNKNSNSRKVCESEDMATWANMGHMAHGQKICPIMSNICPRYAHLKICPIYSQNMPKICHDIPKICPRYPQDIPTILPGYPHDMPNESQWAQWKS